MTIVLMLAVAQWLVFSGRYIVKRDWEKRFLASSTVMAAVWLLGATSPETPVVLPMATLTRSASCVSITPGMTGEEVREKIGAPTTVVSEGDTQGPGADAWVYPNANCVAHMLDGRVRAVGFE